jgi:nicotinamide-nucleotide amidase
VTEPTTSEPTTSEPTTSEPTTSELAADVQRLLRVRGATIAVAESLTGGLLGAALTDLAGSSATFRGGVVAYATDLKASLLGVDPDLLRRHGAVHPDVATAMARGVATRLGSTYGLSTTGVAGPDPQDGRSPGEVHVALAGPAGEGVVRTLQLAGGRDDVRREAARRALLLAADTLADSGKTGL